MYAIGQRVRYVLYGPGSEGEGIIVALPVDPPPNNYLARYRVRHDHVAPTFYIEVGVLEGEIVEVVG
jgi:hypothetical protein